MVKPKFIKAKGDGLDINLALWDGDKDNLFCIHGISSHCFAWNTVANAITPEYKLFAMDIRGRGHSDKPQSGYSITNHCKDIFSVINDLGIKDVVMVGHSLGAYIALVFSALYPQLVKKLILVDGGGKLSEEQRNRVFEGIKPSLIRVGKEFDSFDDYLLNMKNAPFLTPWYQGLEDYYRYEVFQNERGKFRTLLNPETVVEEAENLKKEDISEYYSKLQVETYILRATKPMVSKDDILLPEDVAQFMLKSIPKAKLFNINGSNHYTILLYPNKERDELIREILSGNV